MSMAASHAKTTCKSLGRLQLKNGGSWQALSQGRRAFSSSNASLKHGAVPSFSEASSEELNNLFSTYRSRIFLPAHLSKDHQKLITKEKNKPLLEEEPARIQIAGETFRLEHIPFNKALSFEKGLVTALSLMKTKQDWNNLLPFLAGYKNCGYKMDLDTKARMVRKACLAGRLDVLLECAKRVDYTGFTLKEAILVVEMACHAQRNAARGGWKAKDTAKALSMVEEIAYMLEDKRHWGGGYEISKLDPRTRPELIGVLLQLSSVLALKHQGGKDENEKVKTYATRFRAIMESGEEIWVADISEENYKKRVKMLEQLEDQVTELQRELASKSKQGGNDQQQHGLRDQLTGLQAQVEKKRKRLASDKKELQRREDHAFLYRVAPILHGMKLAQRVLERRATISHWLKAQEKVLGEMARSEYKKLCAYSVTRQEEMAHEDRERETTINREESIPHEDNEPSEEGENDSTTTRDEKVPHEDKKPLSLDTYELLLGPEAKL